MTRDDERQRWKQEQQKEREAFLGDSRKAGPIEDEEVVEEPVADAKTDLPYPADGLKDLYAPAQHSLEEIGAWLMDRAKEGHALLEPLDREARERRRAEDREVVRELPVDVDPHDLGRARWGVVCTRQRFHQVEGQLRPLLEHRQLQMGLSGPLEPLFVEAFESAAVFLARHHETVGTIDPRKVPYYLLIVGGPEEIPWDFQYQLAVNHAVGRVAFDAAADYGRYARAVCNAETRGSRLGRHTALFSVENEGDKAVPFLTGHLVDPLHERLSGYVPGWEVQMWRRREATPHDLRNLLAGGPQAPGLLLVSCHGMPVDPRAFGDDVQRQLQGALVCQREAGREGPWRFGASEVPEEADLEGQISFLFACYGAGTPTLDNYPDLERPETSLRDEPRQLAEAPFVARLPQALLSRGSLGVVGHVDRGWTLSFVWSTGGRQISAVGSLEDSVKRLLLGDRLGHALRPLHRRGAALSARLSLTLDRVRQGMPVDPEYLAEQWIGHNDARNFVLLGDPAVYLLGQRSGDDVVRLPQSLARELRGRAEERQTTVEELLGEALDALISKDGKR